MGERESFNIFVSDWEASPGRLDPNTVVCAIGDVHGQLGHISALVDWLSSNALSDPAKSRHLITLGDYVDRGQSSLGVMDFIGRLNMPDVGITRLRGNHEVYLEAFLNDPSCDFGLIDEWRFNGGGQTLFEMGITNDDLWKGDMAALREQAKKRMSTAALQCLSELQNVALVGDYLFVHAGVYPNEQLDLNDVETLTWIREPFLAGEQWDHNFVVVHGHTPCGPDVKAHRVACDSGAYYTGVLTCAQFENNNVRFIATTSAPDLGGLARIKKRREVTAERWIRV
jgi:serine/threonine protein phosphatase 1